MAAGSAVSTAAGPSAAGTATGPGRATQPGLRPSEASRASEAASRERPARSDRGLTTRGRCLFAGGIAAVVCAILLDERDLLRVGVVAIALPVVAMLFTRSRRVNLAADHQALPERLRPGTSGVVRLLLTNASGSRTRPLEVVEPATPDLTQGVRCLLPPLKAGVTGVVSYPLEATRRGRFVIGPPRVRVADPFGLWEDNRVIPSRTEVMVVPRVVPLTGMPASAGARSAASGQAVSGTTGGDPDVGIRQYHPGDDIRTIHWRASARHDELMVRLEEPVSHGGTSVLLDHRAAAHRGFGAASSLEVAVTLAASVSLHLLDGDYQVKLVGHTGSVIAAGNDIADDVLAGLADIDADVVGDLLPTAVQTPGLLVAVLGDLEPTDARRLIAAKPRSSRGVALLLDVAGWDPAGGAANSAAVAATVFAAAGWRVVVVHPGDDLADIWRRACRAESYRAAETRVS